jgi:uncharacterized protein YgiM (DUF1202 family)
MSSKNLLFVLFLIANFLFILPASAKVLFDGSAEDILNIRSGPGTSYRKVGSLKAGATFQVLEQKNGWDRVGTDRWVIDSYVKRLVATLKTESSVSSDPFTGQAAAALNVRSGAGTGYKIVSKLSVGSSVSVEGQKSGWYRIGANKWVMGKYIKKVTAAVASPATTTTEEDPFASSGPSSSVVASMPATAISAAVQRTTGTAACMAAIKSANAYCVSVASGCPSYSKTEKCVAANQKCEERQMAALSECPSTATP